MIKYNNSDISKWYYDTSDIIKVYRNGAVCYYKIISSGGTPTYQVCYAVVDDISQYSDTEFEDVYNKADSKWYKLNNLNQYEEYGVYGSGRTITYYEGKLTVDTETPPSRLPQGYTEVEYISSEDISESVLGPYIDTNYKPTQNTRFVIEYQSTTNTRDYQRIFGSGEFDMLGYLVNIEGKIGTSGYYYYKFGQTSSWYTTSVQCDLNRHVIDYNNSKQFLLDNVSIATLPNNSFTCSSNLGIFWSINTKYTTNNINFIGRIFSAKVYENGILVRDFVPCISPNNIVGMYDIVNDVFYTSTNNYSFKAGNPIAPTKTYEYMYSGGSWTNVGEVSGSSITIKSPEYIEKDSSHNGKINLDYVWKTNSKMQFKFYSTNNGGGSMIGEDGMPDNNDCRMFFASTTAYFDWGSKRISWGSNGRTNTLYEYEYGNYYIKNMVTSASKTSSTISTSRTNTLYFGLGGTDRFRTYYLKFYDGDTLVKDFIPWTDMEGNYGFFDKVSLSVYNVASGTLTGSSNVTDVEVGGGYEYPLEYPVKQDPPDNLVFSTMAEAEDYECPWVGMKATIDGDKYVFSGDSQSGYEWVEVLEPTYYTLQELEESHTTTVGSCNISMTPTVSGITKIRLYVPNASTSTNCSYLDINSDSTQSNLFAISTLATGQFYQSVQGYNSVKAAADDSNCQWAYWVDASTMEIDILIFANSTGYIANHQVNFSKTFISFCFE